nr:secreted phosphoprotein 24 [Chrysemys picta bellii]
MKTLFIFALVMSVWSCSGLPVYDYEPSIMEEALRASIGRVNSRSQWPALFGIVRSYVRGQTAFCRSTVRVSEEQIQNLAVYCSQDGSSSESSSSEEMMFMEMMAPNRRGDSRNEAQLAPEAFSAGRRRQSYKAQRQSS